MSSPGSAWPLLWIVAKRANEDWSEGALKTALTPESLSIAADDYMDSFSMVRRHVRERLKVLQAEVA